MSLANHVPLSPLTFLARACRAFPGKIAVVDGDGTEVSYETLGRDCAAMAGALRARGIRPGDRVAVLDLNSRWLLAAHYGVPGAGAALVALNSRLAAPEYQDILAHSRARVLLLSPALLPALAVSSADELPVETVVLLPAAQDPAGPGDGQTLLPGAWSYAEWLAGCDSRGIELPGDEDAMIAVNYTSGTTGRPKGVVYTHRGAYLNAVSVALEFGLSASSWHLWTLPMFHCNGWSLTWGVTTVGATNVCLPSFGPDRALDLIARYPVTHLCGAPVVLSELARAGARRGFVAGRLVRAAVGGAPPTKETIAAVQQMGFQVTHLYGLTETYGPSLVCEYQPGWADLPAAALAERVSRQGVPTVSVGDVRVADRAAGPGPGGRPDRRGDPGPVQHGRGGLPGRRAGHGGGVPRRLVPHRRPGRAAPRWLHRADRPEQGRDHQRRREHRLGRGGEGPRGAPAGPRGRRGRRARPALGRAARRVRDHGGRRGHRAGADRVRPRTARPLQGPGPGLLRGAPQDVHRQDPEARAARGGPRADPGRRRFPGRPGSPAGGPRAARGRARRARSPGPRPTPAAPK